jgi:hypothetical protein
MFTTRDLREVELDHDLLVSGAFLEPREKPARSASITDMSNSGQANSRTASSDSNRGHLLLQHAPEVVGGDRGGARSAALLLNTQLSLRPGRFRWTFRDGCDARGRGLDSPQESSACDPPATQRTTALPLRPCHGFHFGPAQDVEPRSPPLFEASRARSEVVPLFVLKPALLRASRNRDRFLLESRVDLARSIGSAVD